MWGEVFEGGAFRRCLGEDPGGSLENRLVETGSCHESGSVGSSMLENPQRYPSNTVSARYNPVRLKNVRFQPPVLGDFRLSKSLSFSFLTFEPS